MSSVVKPENWIRRLVTCQMCDTSEDRVAEQGSFAPACLPCVDQLRYNFWQLWREANEAH